MSKSKWNPQNIQEEALKYDRRTERYNSPNQIISIEEDLRVQPL